MENEIKVLDQMYEGKAKQVFATTDPEIVMVHYKDDATAGDGEKKGTIRDKGIVNNKLSNALMQKLEKEGIPTHYVKELNDRDTLVKKVEIVPLEVIIRNVAAGHFTLRMACRRAPRSRPRFWSSAIRTTTCMTRSSTTTTPWRSTWPPREEIDTITKYAFKVNEVLKKILLDANIRLIDFKLEFGRLADGTIILADEISPDTCRFWDATTGAHLDKDLFPPRHGRRGRRLPGSDEAPAGLMRLSCPVMLYA